MLHAGGHVVADALRTFTVVLRDATHSKEIEGISSFVGEDATGSFGILAGHARMATSLVVGLARIRTGNGDWLYLAVPGALLYFLNDTLTIATRRFLLDDDFTRINSALKQQLLAEEEELRGMKESLRRMEEHMLKRLYEIGQGGAP